MSSNRVAWNGDINSIKSFFKYMVTLWKAEGTVEKEYTSKEIYLDYVEYCRNVEIDYFTSETYLKVLSSLGVESKVVWREDRRVPIRIRILTLDSMLQLILGFEDNFFVTTQIVSLQGKSYLMTTKLKEINTPKEEEAYPEVQMIINKDNFNNYGKQQSTTTNEQPTSDDAGGGDSEA